MGLGPVDIVVLKGTGYLGLKTLTKAGTQYTIDVTCQSKFKIYNYFKRYNILLAYNNFFGPDDNGRKLVIYEFVLRE